MLTKEMNNGGPITVSLSLPHLLLLLLHITVQLSHLYEWMDASNRGGKLFFCFNSHFFSSSSSMNISSRSILSPARHRDHPLSLSASLSLRLRSDGVQSPSKKRTAGGLENPEPSSPKVTCIGQVRVKSKKKKKNINKHARKLRNPSRRRSGGDGSFRRMDNWGSVDLSFNQSNIPENRHRNQRWVHLPFTICEGLKGLGAEISCLSSSCFSSSSKRGIKRERSIRSNLEKMEICREKLEANKLDAFDDEDREEEEEGRVSVCVPPKNALLLMRCRSDPMRMAALSRRLLESPSPNGDDEAESCSQEEEEGTLEKGESFNEDRSVMDVELQEECEEKEEEDGERGSTEEGEIEQRNDELEEEEEDGNRSLTMEEEEEEDGQKGSRMDEEEEEDIQIGTTMEAEEEKEIELKCEDLAMECEMGTVEDKPTNESEEEKEEEEEEDERERPPPPPSPPLPDSLPKVSTEISKETWVCTTDFIQFLPHRHRPANKTLADIDEPEKKKLNPTNTNPSRPRSSCSIPGNAAPMSTAQKLPRCKSEPMRTAAAKLVPSETCIGF